MPRKRRSAPAVLSGISGHSGYREGNFMDDVKLALLGDKEAAKLEEME